MDSKRWTDVDERTGRDDDRTVGRPGASTLTARLAPARQVILRLADPASARAFGEALRGGGVVQRDAAGVAEGAEGAVAAASTSSGQPLRDDLRARFESSLGVDLGAVRVHTGPDSAAASAAVGARAYTVGNDIHFGADRYRPDDPFGMHLLAHEVAHTVQQAGGAVTRQHKLEVSSPGDALEQEADRAADAMVDGRPFAAAVGVGAAPARVAREADMETIDAGLKPQPPAPLPPVAAGSATVPAPDALDWSNTPAAPSSPSQGWYGVPTFHPTFSSPGNLDTYRIAFTASWADAQTSFNKIVRFHDTLHGTADRLAPILRIGDAAKVGAEGTNANATDAFKGGALKPSASTLDSSKVAPETRRAILKLKGEIDAARLDTQAKALAVKNSENGVTQAGIDVAMACHALSITKTDADIEATGLDRAQVTRDLDDYKADVKLAADSAKTAGSMVAAYFDPTKLADVFNNTVNTTASLAENSKIKSTNQQLAAIDAKVGVLQRRKASLASTNAGLLIDSKVVALTTARNAVQIALNQYEAAVIAARAKHVELAAEMQKAGEAQGGAMSKQDAKLLAAAVEAVPQIQEIITFCTGMAAAIPPPAYSEASGIGAAMATNTSEFLRALAVIKGTAQYVADTRATWQSRLVAVQAAIDSATAV